MTVGAHASVLGNITIGHDSKIGASASILRCHPGLPLSGTRASAYAEEEDGRGC